MVAAPPGDGQCRAIMDALAHACRRVVFMKAAQVGATEAGNNWIGFAIHQAPGPMLAVQPTVDESTNRSFRERLTAAGVIGDLFDAFDRRLRGAGCLAMGDRIVDASLVSTPRQRNDKEEKEAIKAGKSACEIWPEKPAKTV